MITAVATPISTCCCAVPSMTLCRSQGTAWWCDFDGATACMGDYAVSNQSHQVLAASAAVVPAVLSTQKSSCFVLMCLLWGSFVAAVLKQPRFGHRQCMFCTGPGTVPNCVVHYHHPCHQVHTSLHAFPLSQSKAPSLLGKPGWGGAGARAAAFPTLQLMCAGFVPVSGALGPAMQSLLLAEQS